MAPLAVHPTSTGSCISRSASPCGHSVAPTPQESVGTPPLTRPAGYQGLPAPLLVHSFIHYYCCSYFVTLGLREPRASCMRSTSPPPELHPTTPQPIQGGQDGQSKGSLTPVSPITHHSGGQALTMSACGAAIHTSRIFLKASSRFFFFFSLPHGCGGLQHDTETCSGMQAP